MRSDITPGQTSDYRGFDLVMDDNLPAPAVLIAERGYDSDKVRKTMEARNVTADQTLVTDLRSAEALAALKAAGLKNSVHVQGGVLAWAAQVDPSLPTY